MWSSLLRRAFLLIALLFVLVGTGPTVAVGAQDAGEPTTTTDPPTTTVPTTVVPTSVPASTSTTAAGVTTTMAPGTSTTTTTDPDDEQEDEQDDEQESEDDGEQEDEESDDADGTDGPSGSPVPSYDPAELAEILAGYDEAVAEHAELLAQYELSVTELDQLNAAMVELSERIGEVEDELLGAETAATQAEGRVATAEVRLADVERQLAESRDLLADQAVDAYIYGGENPAFYALLNAESADEMETSREYARAVIEDTDDTIAAYALLEIEAEQLRAEAADAAADAREARDEVAARRDVLRDERETQAQAQADAFVTALAQKGLIDQVEAQRGAYEERLRGLAGSSDSVNNILKQRQENQTLPADTERILLPPIPSPNLASPFGPRLHPIFGTVRMHNGLDIDAAMGAPVRASADGEVVIAGWQGGYGNTVVIDHGNGLGTLYAHQSSLLVEVGDEVEMGDVIALAGSTGWSTGPHVHWEVRVFGNPTDPFPFMGGEELLAPDPDD